MSKVNNYEMGAGKMTLKKVVLVVFLGVFLLLLSHGLPVSAGALADSYDQLTREFPDYITRLKEGGAKDDQIRSFVSDLDAALQGQPLTEENFNSALIDAATQLISQGKHQAVVEAIWKAFPNDLPELLQGRVPEGLQPLYNMLKEKLLAPSAETPPGPGSSSGSSGGTSPPAGSGGGAGGIAPSPEVSKEISAATGGSLSLAGLTVEVPGGALPASAIVSVKKLAAGEAGRVAPPALGLKLASAVYEINTTGSRSFHKEITVRLSFDPAKIAPGEQPAAYFYNGTSWIKIGGTVEDNTVVARIDHLTIFAVFSTPAEASAAPPVKTFADIANHWAKQDIETMLARNLVAGVSPGEFAPDRTVTRAEFAALLVRAVGIPVSPALRSSFADVPAGAW
ncbi:MAG: S-layer homology domain-containing protein, partial [Moorella sp. (in: Bacteria)]|nr:S-layer homology domain-containing protein [Moorella sp. (in: firmicutes)]